MLCLIHLYLSKVTLQVCKKTSQKLHALARIVNYMDLSKRKVLIKAFIISLSSYCSLIWMLHSRTLNNRINDIHERALRLRYKDKQSSFKDVLEKDHSVTVHHRAIQVLVTENFKVKIDLFPDIMKDVFELIQYNLRSEWNHFIRRNFKTTYYGLLSIRHIAPQMWELASQSIRRYKTLKEFKTKIKSWYPDHCPCRLCKTYIAQSGFIWSAYIRLFMAELGYILVIIAYVQYDVIMLPCFCCNYYFLYALI